MGKWLPKDRATPGDDSTGNSKADAERKKFYDTAKAKDSDATARQDALEKGREAAQYGRDDDPAYWREARRNL